MKNLFQLSAHDTTVGRELGAGLTTFAAMAYILAVNPSILAVTGMDRGALVTVTALSAAAATTLMALLTNYPIALAPGMGINAFSPTPSARRSIALARRLGHGVRQRDRVPAPVRHRHPRAGGGRDSLSAQDRDHLRHRSVHRFHRTKKRRDHHRAVRHARDPTEIFPPRRWRCAWPASR